MLALLCRILAVLIYISLGRAEDNIWRFVGYLDLWKSYLYGYTYFSTNRKATSLER